MTLVHLIPLANSQNERRWLIIHNDLYQFLSHQFTLTNFPKLPASLRRLLDFLEQVSYILGSVSII